MDPNFILHFAKALFCIDIVLSKVGLVLRVLRGKNQGEKKKL